MSHSVPATHQLTHALRQPLSERVRLVLVWLFTAGLAVASCALIWPAAHLGNEYLPVGNDSFYHARRILDTAQDPASFYEFDSKIHAPEGSQLVWPWGFDYVLGWVVRIGMKVGLASEPMAILVWIPTAAVTITMCLFVLLGRRLNLSHWTIALAGLCVALLPLTQYLYGVGFVDHHFAEHIFTLAALLSTLTWLQRRESVRAAALAGVVLGLAPAAHNALFILQIPVLLTLALWWVQGMSVSRLSARYFAASVVITTLLILIPSEPFRAGAFEYFLLSWFHLYVAAGTGVVVLYFSHVKFGGKALAALALLAAVLLSPLLYQVVLAGSFLTGKVTRLDAIAEMKSPLELARLYGWKDITNRYSWFIWLTPVTAAFCCARLWLDRNTPRVAFWVFSVLGLALLVTQFRLHYFGSYALYLPWLILAEEVSRRVHAKRNLILLATTVLVVLAYSAPMRNQLLGPMQPANEFYFRSLRPVYDALAQACAEDPGIVLADNDAGHPIRYYTECAVIANNFLLTPIHEQKILEMDALFAMRATELPVAAPNVKYVLVRPASIHSPGDDTVRYMSFSPSSSQLVADLLLRPHADKSLPIPDSYELLFESVLYGDDNETEYPYARLYKVKHPSEVSLENVRQ